MEIIRYTRRYEYRPGDPLARSGFSFDCLADGTLLPPENEDVARTRAKFNAALAAGRLDDKGVQGWGAARPADPCPCGSGECSERKYDGHGIYLGRCCPKCERQFLARFRPDIMRRYASDEPVEAI